MELSPREKVLLIATHLAVGSSDASHLCTFCGGGEHKDKGFSVTRVDKIQVAYKCHRDKCGKSGYVFLNGGGGEETVVPSFQPCPYRGMTSNFEYDDLVYLDNKYGLNLDYVIKAGWVKAQQPSGSFNIVMPVWGPTGKLRGHVVRRVLDHDKKEVRTYKIEPEPWLCWYRTSGADIVVVEDQISALKAAAFTTSVALLGTHLSLEKLTEIQIASKGNIYLAFDKDASKSSIEYFQKYRAICPNLYVILLQKDLKNMDYGDIMKLGEPFINVRDVPRITDKANSGTA